MVSGENSVEVIVWRSVETFHMSRQECVAGEVGSEERESTLGVLILVGWLCQKVTMGAYVGGEAARSGSSEVRGRKEHFTRREEICISSHGRSSTSQDRHRCH